jgi:hypothetical protein
MTVGSLRQLETSRLSRSARARRWHLLAERFPDLAEMSVLDLGGTERSWDLCPVAPRELTLVNMPDPHGRDTDRIVLGDACDPGLLLDRHFDLVYSNSVIEHVGGHYRRQEFAANVRRLGDHYWVQTPYRYFPLEPHFFMPAAQWLPEAARIELANRWPLGNVTARRGQREIMTKIVLEIDLLSKTAMRYAFPDAELVSERVGGLVKSLIAVR